MGVLETNYFKKLALEAGIEGNALYRVHAATGWNSPQKKWCSKPQVCDPAFIRELRTRPFGRILVLFDPSPLQSGCVGISDCIGWTKVEDKAVFTAVEVKTKGTRVTKEQREFIEQVNLAGGIGRIDLIK